MSTIKTVICTGSCGFIGSWVANTLHERGYRVIGVDNLVGGVRENMHPDILFSLADVSEAPTVNRLFHQYQPEFVVHCASFAAEGLANFVRTYSLKNVVLATENLINASINSGSVKYFSYFSSIAVMGGQTPPFTEEMNPSPIDVYGAGKLFCEHSLKSAHDLWGLNYNIWRCHNVVGRRQALSDGYRNFATIAIRAIMERRPIPIFSTGGQTRAFTPIQDVSLPVCAALEREHAWNETFNLGADKPYSVMELAQMISDAMGVKLEVQFFPARHEAEHAYSDHTKARRFFPEELDTVSLQEEIKAMAEWAVTQKLRPVSKFSALEITKGLPSAWA